MAELKIGQTLEFTVLLLDYAQQWHKAHLVFDKPEFDVEFKKEQDCAMKLFNFIQDL